VSHIQQNIEKIRNEIRASELYFKRKPGSVFLLPVSKGQSVEKIKEAIASGEFAFAENYVQEALEKINILKDFSSSLEWHFIGAIQRNKTKKIAEYFDWVHSVSSLENAKRLNKERPLFLPPLSICLQVNISEEKSKSGLLPSDVFSLAESCLSLPRLRLRGLMVIPAVNDKKEEQRIPFRQCRLLFEELNQKGFKLDTLSMGMSNDWQSALAEGSTMLRIGTAIFGER
jgi:pyridoxal phosphate enzyme (YggS family)